MAQPAIPINEDKRYDVQSTRIRKNLGHDGTLTQAL